MKAFAVLAVALALFALAEAGDKKGWNMKCDGQDMKMKKDNDGWKACLDKYAPATELAADATDEDKKKAWHTRFHSVHNNTCFQVCKYTAKKVFDDAGAFSQTGAEAMIDSIYPTTELATSMKDGIKKCADGITWSMDNECAAYKPFIACMHKTHFEVCKVEAKKQTEEAEP